MRFNVYDFSLNRIDMITTWYSCLWTVNYNDVGSITLELDARAYDYEKLKPMKFITCDGLTEHIMVITSIDINGTKAVLNGFTADYLLGNKVMLEKIGKSQAYNIIYSLYHNMQDAPNKQLPMFAANIVNEMLSTAVRFERQKSNASMLDFLRVICQTCDIGYKTVLNLTTRKIDLVLYQESENIVNRFSAKYGNVSNETYTYSKNGYANVAVVLGQATNFGRIMVTVGDTSTTGVDRLEILVDARDQQQESDESENDYKDRLRERGWEKLAEAAISESYDFEIIGDEKLGAMVQIELTRPAMRFNARITGKEFKSQNNIIEKKITVGKPIL